MNAGALVNEAAPTTLIGVERAVEVMLATQLLKERMRSLPNEVEREFHMRLLDAFEDWASEYDLLTTPHVFAAYLVELHKIHGIDVEDLKTIAGAYLSQYDRDVC